jgi:hypothetical protein
MLINQYAILELENGFVAEKVTAITDKPKTVEYEEDAYKFIWEPEIVEACYYLTRRTHEFPVLYIRPLNRAETVTSAHARPLNKTSVEADTVKKEERND